MSKITPKTSITQKGVDSAVSRALAGEEGEIKDATCKGLSLRMRGKAVTWTIRWKWNDRYKRWTLGNHEVLPDEARRRGWHVKGCCQQGIDPTPQIREWISGIPLHRQLELRKQEKTKSITWAAARKLFLDHIFSKRGDATYDDYKNILHNTPELKRFEGRMVAGITKYDVSAVYKDVFRRAEPHSEHVQRVLSSMWTFLGNDDNSPTTGVAPRAIMHTKAPERTRQQIEDMNEGDEAPPDRIQIGRYVAIAKLGVFSERMSCGLLVLAGSAQRRRPVAGSHRENFQTFDDEELWKMPPYFRKPSKKKRSKGKHLVPLVGFAAKAIRKLDLLAGEQPWLLPVSRPRRVGQQPKHEYMEPGALNQTIAAMPGVRFGTHAFRVALASYGTEDLGWFPDDAKLILDHLEGFSANDVTAQHYNLNPEIIKKRRMMKEWIGWLEQQEAKAIADDPTLLDREAVAEQVYQIRYGDEAWATAIKKSKDTGKPTPWAAPA